MQFAADHHETVDCSPALYEEYKAFYLKKVKPEFQRFSAWAMRVDANFDLSGFNESQDQDNTPNMNLAFNCRGLMMNFLGAVQDRVVFFDGCAVASLGNDNNMKMPKAFRVDVETNAVAVVQEPSVEALTEEWALAVMKLKTAISMASVLVRNLVVKSMKSHVMREKTAALAQALNRSQKRAIKDKYQRIMVNHTASFKRVMRYVCKLLSATQDFAAEQKKSRDLRAVKRASRCALV